jgi:hypothetical protein
MLAYTRTEHMKEEMRRENEKFFVSRNDFLNMSPSTKKGIKTHILMIIDK